MPKSLSHASSRLAALAVLASFSVSPRLDAQRRGGTSSVRAEMASVLLQSKRYGEAAGEYRALLARDPNSFSYRLGLARALAWGGRPREAERELLVLRSRSPRDETVAALLQSVREAMTPGSSEARAWLAERPDYAPYRLALARAYANEHQTRLAAEQYDILLSRREGGRLPIANAYAERARIRLELGDRAGAESDVRAAMSLGATVQTWILLGDIYRERGDISAARATYQTALRSARTESDRNAALTGLARLERETRPLAAFATTVGDDPGWRLSTEAAGDNLGIRYLSTILRRSVPLSGTTTAGVSILHQYLGERSAARVIDLQAIGATASVAEDISYGSFLGRIGLTGGGVHVESSGVFIGSVAATAWFSGWELGLEGFSGPAYPSLLTTTAVSPTDGIGGALTEQDFTVTFGGPVALGDFAASAQRSLLSDGNTRVTLQALVRVPLSTGVSAVYQGTSTSFAKRSVQYWDPMDYMAHGAGLEFAVRRIRGLSATLRAFPGFGKTTELLLPTPSSSTSRTTARAREPVTHSAFQFGADGSIGWRDERWDAGAALTYGRGRAGEYQRTALTLGLRLTP
jgi:tetratricopeptide (TPR) repeat protein